MVRAMKRITGPLAVFAVIVFSHCSLLAQGTAPTGGTNSQGSGGVSPGITGFWEIDCPGGRFVIQLNHISSVSQHEYVIDGAFRVTECTVDTSGSVTARFYYIEPTGASSSAVSGSATYERLKNVANRVSNKAGMGDAEHIVSKNYPTTTHAKTSEYRFKSKDTIGRIYNHVHKVWALEKGRGKSNKITIRE